MVGLHDSVHLTRREFHPDVVVMRAFRTPIISSPSPFVFERIMASNPPYILQLVVGLTLRCMSSCKGEIAATYSK